MTRYVGGNFMVVLGVWDGHDSGACIVDKGRIKTAVNEERFTRRKLEPLFPKNSVEFCLRELELKPSEIENVAFSTSDFSLTLTRLFPRIKNDYWYVRRKLVKERNPKLNRKALSRTGELHSNGLFRALSKKAVRNELKRIGFGSYKLHVVDHHMAHAASAYYTSGFKKAVCVTLDGLGDGLSSTVNICNDGEIERVSASHTRDSLGLFFQEVTKLLGMRLLEDECKVMALSDYAKGGENPLLGLFEVDGTRLKCKKSPSARYQFLKKIMRSVPKEEFCLMAQSTVEEVSKKLFQNAISETSINDVVWSGGVASNIKMNMVVRTLPEVRGWFVFPQMGDGGLAAGAALQVSNKLFDTKPYKLENLYFGPRYDIKPGPNHEEVGDIEGYVADLISDKGIVFWFQDRMEYGPRALGNRSIIGAADDFEIRNRVNKVIKKREWYQPFCPSLLEEDAQKVFGEISRPDRFMTMGYKVTEEMREKTAAVTGKDNSARPQIVGDENPRFKRLLKRIKKKTGSSIILNTSFNIHGQPIVMSPKDAVETLKQSKGNPHLVLGNHMVTK